MNKQVDTFKNRFNIAISNANIRPAELAEITKLSKSTISHYMSGYTQPKSDKLFILSKALNVSEAWLMGLDVPMERPSLNFDTIPDDTPWNRALSKLQTGETLTDEEEAALHEGLPRVMQYKQAMLKFAEQWNASFYEKKLLNSFSDLSEPNKKKVILYTENLLDMQVLENEQTMNTSINRKENLTAEETCCTTIKRRPFTNVIEAREFLGSREHLAAWQSGSLSDNDIIAMANNIYLNED